MTCGGLYTLIPITLTVVVFVTIAVAVDFPRCQRPLSTTRAYATIIVIIIDTINSRSSISDTNCQR